MKKNRTCPHCAESVKADAKVCKHCGHQFTTADFQAWAAADRKEMKAGLFGCGGLLAVRAVIAAIAWEGSDNPPAAGGSDPKADFVRLYRNALGAARKCDEANSAVADRVAAISGDAGQMYGVWLELAKLEVPPSISGDARKRAEQALEDCHVAYYSREKSLETMMSALDGQAKPSLVSKFKDKAELAQAGTVRCVAKLFDAGYVIGVEPKQLQS